MDVNLIKRNRKRKDRHLHSGFKSSLVYFKITINFLEKEDVDYCVKLLLFVLVLCKMTLPPTTETERTLIKSFNFEDILQSLYA